MSIAFSSEVMDHRIKFVCAHARVSRAGYLKHWFDLDYVIYLGKVHVSLAEYEPLQVNDEDVRQRVDLSLFWHLSFLFAIIAG